MERPKKRLATGTLILATLGAGEIYREYQRNTLADNLVEPAAKDFLEIVENLKDNRGKIRATVDLQERQHLETERDKLSQEAALFLNEIRGHLRDICNDETTWYLQDYPNCVYLNGFEASQPIFQRIETINVLLKNTDVADPKYPDLLAEKSEIYNKLDSILDVNTDLEKK